MGETIRMNKISNPTLRLTAIERFYVDVFGGAAGGGNIFLMIFDIFSSFVSNM